MRCGTSLWCGAAQRCGTGRKMWNRPKDQPYFFSRDGTAQRGGTGPERWNRGKISNTWVLLNTFLLKAGEQFPPGTRQIVSAWAQAHSFLCHPLAYCKDFICIRYGYFNHLKGTLQVYDEDHRWIVKRWYEDDLTTSKGYRQNVKRIWVGRAPHFYWWGAHPIVIGG